MSERDRLWNAFIANPECVARKAESEPDGHPLVTYDSQLLKPAAFFSLVNHD